MHFRGALTKVKPIKTHQTVRGLYQCRRLVKMATTCNQYQIIFPSRETTVSPPGSQFQNTSGPESKSFFKALHKSNPAVLKLQDKNNNHFSDKLCRTGVQRALSRTSKAQICNKKHFVLKVLYTPLRELLQGELRRLQSDVKNSVCFKDHTKEYQNALIIGSKRSRNSKRKDRHRGLSPHYSLQM